jgi:hypothetical protein
MYRFLWRLPLLSCDMPWTLPPLSDTWEGLDDEFPPGLMPIKQASPDTQCSNKNSHNIITEHTTHTPYLTTAYQVIKKGKVGPEVNYVSTIPWRHMVEWMYISIFSWCWH